MGVSWTGIYIEFPLEGWLALALDVNSSIYIMDR